MTTKPNTSNNFNNYLILGATGKTGRRIVTSLQDMGKNVRIGSRSADLPFDWDNESGWDACLEEIPSWIELS